MFTTDKTGHMTAKYFLNKGRLQHKDGIKELTDYLTKRTSVSTDDSVDIQSVDIQLPAPFLKVNQTMKKEIKCIEEYVLYIQFNLARSSNLIKFKLVNLFLYATL